MGKSSRVALCVLLVGMIGMSAACKKKAAGAGDGGDAGETSIFPPGSGLAAVGNDPAVVAEARSMIAACGAKYDAVKGWPSECKKTWNDMTVKEKDATFVALLEDPDAKVRELGANGLARWGYTYRTDKDLGTRAVAALEREPALPFNAQLAYVVDDIDLAKVPVGDRIKALGIGAKTPTDVRIAITVWWAQRTGAKNLLAYDVVKANIPTTDKKLRIAVLDGYAEFDEVKHDEACGYWATNMADPDNDIAGVAYGHLTRGWSGVNAHDSESDWYVTGGGHGGDLRCPQVDQAIALAEQKAKAGQIKDSNFVYGLSFVAKDKKAPPAQKKAAIAALKDVVSIKANSSRYAAVNALGDVDPPEKAFLERFKADPDLGSTVKTALAPKKK